MIDFHDDFSEVHTQSKKYLALPLDYFAPLGAAKWTDSGEGLAFARPEDLTRFNEVIAYEQIAQFFEGFASQRAILSMGAMAHWLMRLAFPAHDGGQFDRLRRAFVESGDNWRTAGALAGMVSADLGEATYQPATEVICTRLRDRAFPIHWFSGMFNGRMIRGEMPARTAEQFEASVGATLALLTDAELTAWLKFGRGPMRRAGAELAVEPPPRSWGEIVDELLRRPRLAGARTHVDQMVTALSVPPRRHVPEQLPLGGYADVVTHGSLDRLLPSQHALDDIEFLRRFSENELLYFRREEPPAPTRHEIVVALDQGVRTWGDVRHVLTAALLALAQRAEAKRLAFHFTCTSEPGLFEPRAMLVENLGSLLEASDLSRDPGLALERALETPATEPRDFYLLTHPYAVREADVSAAARRLGPRDRLFAVTVDGAGRAELIEMRRGLPVRLKAFLVEFTPAKPPRPAVPESLSNWTGPVEAMAWPFAFVPDGPLQHFDFDDAGKCLLAVLDDGMLCVWDIPSGRREILPRPLIDGVLVKSWTSMVGVAGGFAFLGHRDGRWAVVHYDLGKQVCTVSPMPSSDEGGIDKAVLLYLRRRHTLIVYRTAEATSVGALDLHATSWVRLKSPSGQSGLSFWEFLNRGPIQRKLPAVAFAEEVGGDDRRCYHLEPTTGAIKVADGGTCDPESGAEVANNLWQEFIPKLDGRPRYTDRWFLEVQLAGNTLGILSKKSPRRASLAFYRGPDGAFLRELGEADNRARARFMLSPDGENVAIAWDVFNLIVEAVALPTRRVRARLGTGVAKTRLWVGDGAFLISCGRSGHSWHLVDWRKCFIVQSETNRTTSLREANFKNPMIDDFFRHRNPVESVVGVGNGSMADEGQYRSGARRDGVCFVLDRYGQVLAFNAEGRLTFQFYAYGDSWSASLPGGERCGRGMVHQGADSLYDAAAMAKALQALGRKSQG